jgi:hypothetical protein
MGISVIGAAASSGGGGTNNFVLKTTDEKTYVLDRTYTSGRYSLSFLDSDTTFDIYAIAEDGTYAGYTSSTILEVSADFAEIVVLGAGSGTRISFTHLGVLTEALTSGDVATAGAFASSLVTSSLPSVDDTTVVNGGNFAADVQVSFIDQSAVETAAKTIVRSSSTQLIVTRPDAFSPDDSPYTVKVVNPGIPVPAGTNAHLMSNSVTAGTNPVWTTGTVVPYNVGGATNCTFLATDTEASDIDYSVVSGTLPAGLTLDGETGVLSGTASGTPSEGDVTAITIRAIDTGGNFLDKAFDLTANVAPTWTTAAGVLDPAPAETSAYSFQLVASTGTAGGALTYTLQSGALLAGHSLSTTGVISGTSNGVIDDTATFTVRVTDEGGLFADRSFTTTIVANAVAWYRSADFSAAAITTGYARQLTSVVSSGTLAGQSTAVFENGNATGSTLEAGTMTVDADGALVSLRKWGDGTFDEYDPRLAHNETGDTFLMTSPSNGGYTIKVARFDKTSYSKIWEKEVYPSGGDSETRGSMVDFGATFVGVSGHTYQGTTGPIITLHRESTGNLAANQKAAIGNEAANQRVTINPNNTQAFLSYDSDHNVGSTNNRIYVSAIGLAGATFGDVLWAKRFEPANGDRVNNYGGVGVPSAEGGFLFGTRDFPASNVGTTHPGIVKLDSLGNIVKQYRITATNSGYGMARGVAEDADGFLYMMCYGRMTAETVDPNPTDTRGYIYKIDPNTDSIVWAREIDSSGTEGFFMGFGGGLTVDEKSIQVNYATLYNSVYYGGILNYPTDGASLGSLDDQAGNTLTIASVAAPLGINTLVSVNDNQSLSNVTNVAVRDSNTLATSTWPNVTTSLDDTIS